MYYNSRPKNAPMGFTIVCFHPNSRFQDLDLKKIKIVKAKGLKRNVHSKFWVKDAFNAWKRYKIFDTLKIIGELHKFEPKYFVD